MPPRSLIALKAIRGHNPVAPFDLAAQNSVTKSNPTEPLPSGYPEDQCLFGVTFYDNESPPKR